VASKRSHAGGVIRPRGREKATRKAKPGRATYDQDPWTPRSSPVGNALPGGNPAKKLLIGGVGLLPSRRPSFLFDHPRAAFPTFPATKATTSTTRCRAVAQEGQGAPLTTPSETEEIAQLCNRVPRHAAPSGGSFARSSTEPQRPNFDRRGVHVAALPPDRHGGGRSKRLVLRRPKPAAGPCNTASAETWPLILAPSTILVALVGALTKITNYNLQPGLSFPWSSLHRLKSPPEFL